MIDPSAKDLRRAIAASVIGAVIEWYDFFLYAVVAGIVLNRLYFPTSDPTISTLLAYATFGVGFLARPLGGLIFGHFGDRIGRKSILVMTISIMGVSTIAIGLVPTFAQIGYWAPALLLFFRIVQGIGLGGEWGGAVLLAFEYAPPGRRGFYTSLPQIGLSLGVVLSAGFIGAMSHILSDAQFLAWGWRLGFLLSFVLVVLGLWIRLNVQETPEFASLTRTHREVKVPFLEMVRTAPANMALGLGARHLDGVFFNIFSVFAVSYLTRNIGLSRTDALFGVSLGAIMLSVAMPFFGILSDRVGRARLYFWATIATALSAMPAFWMMNHASGNIYLIWTAIAVPLGLVYAAVYGNTATLLCELFDARVRYTGISFVYQFSSILAGGFTPIIATLLVAIDHGQPWMICGYIIVSGIISTACAFVIGARRGESMA